MTTNPLFSVIIPVFNGEMFLEKTINSVFEQSLRDFEVIAIDDCSNDKSKEILASVSASHGEMFRLIKNSKNQGLMKTNNTGFRAAKGRYVIFLGQDDLLACNHLEILSKELDEEVSFVFVNSFFIDEYGEVGGKIAKNERLSFKASAALTWLIYGNFIPSVGLAINKKRLEDVGGYPEHFKNWGEWALWARLAAVGEVKFCKAVSAYYRRHGANISGNFQTFYGMSSLFPYYLFSMKEAVRVNRGVFYPKVFFVISLMKRGALLFRLWVLEKYKRSKSK